MLDQNLYTYHIKIEQIIWYTLQSFLISIIIISNINYLKK